MALAPGAADAILEHLETSTAQLGGVQLRVLGGAMARVPDDATAFGHRGAKLMVNIAAMYSNPEEGPEHEVWASSLATALADGTASAYVGFLGDEGDQGLLRAYPGATLERLAGRSCSSLKRRLPLQLATSLEVVLPARGALEIAGPARTIRDQPVVKWLTTGASSGPM
jgi:hypothetical protein